MPAARDASTAYNADMCARYTLRNTPIHFLQRWLGEGVEDWQPRYNIAPSQEVVILGCGNAAGDPALMTARWGLSPAGTRGSAMKMPQINARAETVHEKVSFRESFRCRRCVVPADGYYEWIKSGGGRQPYFITLQDDSVFGFAGIWDLSDTSQETSLRSCAIITSEANTLTRRIHARMPVILRPSAVAHWLDPSIERTEELLPLLEPCSEAGMTLGPVSTYVNHVAHEGPACVQPVDHQIQGRLF
ncbi:MAG: SOS response-associated peptidase [Planctomycetota bacterium]|nr:SOS response-associated peptidase [Planctomycetota bacterium]